jgi:TolB-like protein
MKLLVSAALALACCMCANAAEASVTAAEALLKGTHLLDSHDTVAAYAALSQSARFTRADSGVAEMAAFAAMLKPAAERISAHLENVKAAGSGAPRTGTVAVLPFVNNGSPPNLATLETALAEMISTDMAQIERFTVIERSQVAALRHELALGPGGVLDSAASRRIGRMARAERVVVGSFASRDSSISVRAEVVSENPGLAAKQSETGGRLDGFFKIEKELVFLIVKNLDIVLTAAERRAIETIPTENVLAYLAYAKGLDAESAGDFTGAAGNYGEAARLDPRFRQALDALDRAKAAESLRASRAQRLHQADKSEAKATPVFTTGFHIVAPTSAVGLASMNRALAGFIPERPLAAGAAKTVVPAAARAYGAGALLAERNSYLDATNAGPNSGSSVLDATIPVPQPVR